MHIIYIYYVQYGLSVYHQLNNTKFYHLSNRNCYSVFFFATRCVPMPLGPSP